MKQAKLEDTVKLLKEKLQTEDGKLSDPKTLTAWTNNFSDIPEFTSIRRSAQQSGEVRNTQGKIFVLLKVSWVISCIAMAMYGFEVLSCRKPNIFFFNLTLSQPREQKQKTDRLLAIAS